MSLQGVVIAVTGAGGLVGSACCRELTARGAIVRALVRDPARRRAELSSNAPAGVFQFDLGGALDPEALRPPLRALVHCGYVMQSDRRAQMWRCNVDGTRRLFDAAQAAGVEQIVFMSSLAAHEGARSQYGKSKWLLEGDLDSRKGASIKPGTIIGPGGVFRHLRELVKRMPIIPIFYAKHRIQTVLVDDVARAIAGAVEERLTGRLVVAEPQGVTQTDFYRGIAALENRHPLLVRCPGNLALAMTLAFESVGLHLPISSDNVRGIKHIRHFDTGPSSAALHIHPGDFWSSILELARREGAADAISRIESLGQSRR